MKTDAEGVPLLVQAMGFSERGVTVTFFNGKKRMFSVEQVSSLSNFYGIYDVAEVEFNINLLAQDNWRKWFPSLRLV